MKTEVVVVNKKLRPKWAMTSVYDATGCIARFSYDPTSIPSVVQRLKDFIAFSQVRNIEVIEVLGDDLV